MLGFDSRSKESRKLDSALLFKQATNSLGNHDDALTTLRLTHVKPVEPIEPVEPINLPLNTVVKRAFVSELYEQSKRVDAGIEARRQQI